MNEKLSNKLSKKRNSLILFETESKFIKPIESEFPRSKTAGQNQFYHNQIKNILDLKETNFSKKSNPNSPLIKIFEPKLKTAISENSHKNINNIIRKNKKQPSEIHSQLKKNKNLIDFYKLEEKSYQKVDVLNVDEKKYQKIDVLNVDFHNFGMNNTFQRKKLKSETTVNFCPLEKRPGTEEKNILKENTKPKKKIYMAESLLLKKIVKISKPKFEPKLDFLNQENLHNHFRKFVFVDFILKNIKRMSLNPENRINIEKFLELSKDTTAIILQLFPLFKNAIKHSSDRGELDMIMKSIVQKCQISKNMALTLKTLLLHAKISLETQNAFQSIILYRNCKKLAEISKMPQILISCYKGLGKCYQFLKQYSLALVYFTKLLQCSWMQNDKNNELLAYDYIGMQYYYLGDLEKSKYYHLKMVNGETEPKDSTILKLGVNKLKNKNSKNKDKDNKIKHEKDGQFIDNYFSSSDEDFELPNPSNSLRNKSEPDLNFLKKSRSTVTKEGANLMSLIKKTKNKNPLGTISSTEEFKKLLTKNIIQGKISKQNNSGPTSEKLYLSHLSPNRELIAYQNFKPNYLRNINTYNMNDYLYKAEEYNIMIKIKNRLKNYVEKLLLTFNKLKIIFIQKT